MELKKMEKLAYKIGLKPDEFWTMIPSDFISLYMATIEALTEQEKRDNTRTALICTTIANFVPMRTKKGKVFKVKDFMPREPRKAQSVDEMDRQLDNIASFFGVEKTHKKG